ncbi:MAG TPA: hydroxymyristoyl-ACP dehydratase [Thermoanaerobaculia bacterium]|jgi:3-hydroxyacyl-[acyl-carrier-protein] dehydratase
MNGAMNNAVSYDELLRIIPHRAPMLLVDRIEELVRGARATGYKQVSEELSNTLVIDALGQVAIAILSDETSEEAGVWYLASVEDIECGAPVRPGQTLRLEATILRSFKTTVRIALRASVPYGHDVVKGTMVLSNAK